MLSSTTLLSTLIVSASIVGAKLYTDRALHSAPNKKQALGPDEITQDYIEELEEELDRLRNDNTSLRQLVEKDSPLTLPQELIDFVEKDLELTFTSPPLAFVRNQETLRDASGQTWLHAFGEQQLEMLSYSFDVLGILPTDAQWIGQVIAAETTGSRGIYDASTKEIVLAEDFDLENIHHQAAFTRLLAIALLDQHFPAEQDMSFDSFIARRALHHGRASALQDRFYTLQAKHMGFITERAPNTEAAQLFAQLPIFVRDITTFPNQYGKGFAKKHPDSLSRSDLTTSEIFGAQNAFTSKADNAPHSAQIHTKIGSLTLGSFLKQNSIPAAAQNLAFKHFQTDSLTILVSENNQVETRWNISLANTSAAGKIAQSIRDQLTESSITVAHDKNQLTLSFTEALENQ
jgi:hypothetical protein